VEGRYRFPVRVRYDRAFRDDEQQVKRLLVTRGKRSRAAGRGTGSGRDRVPSTRPAADIHEVRPWHMAEEGGPLQVPLAEVADVRVVEGPAVIKSENGLLRSYVTM